MFHKFLKFGSDLKEKNYLEVHAFVDFPATATLIQPTFVILTYVQYLNGGRGSRVVKVSDSGWPCHEFEPSTTKDPPCRAAMHVKSVESSNVLSWCGMVVRRGVPAQVSSTSLDHGSKLRGPSPKALV
ncbi:hypothetical protein TNCV_3360101 [Trichonephila clavipes]|nr:hypothetical protein TNCV_3360101 [Trichonephila clavipes]